MENLFLGMGLGILVGLLFLFLTSGIYFVNPDEKADIYRLGVFKKNARQGRNFLVPIIDRLISFPSSIQEVDLVSENVMIAAEPGHEEQSQTIDVNLLQPFFVIDIDLVFKKIGVRKIEDLLIKFFGKMNEEGKWMGGLVGSFEADLLRSYVASDKVVYLDDAYKMRDDLAEYIKTNLMARFPESEYGIRWEKTIVRDVKAGDEIEKARGAKAKAAIERDQAKINAEGTVIVGRAEAEAQLAKGAAEAGIERNKGLALADVEKARGLAKATTDLAQGQAQAQVDRARGKAAARNSFLELKAKLDILGLSEKVTQSEAAKFLAILLFGTEFADKLKGMGNFNILLTPDLGRMLKSLFGGRQTINAQNLFDAFMNLDDGQRKEIAEKIGQLLGGKK